MDTARPGRPGIARAVARGLPGAALALALGLTAGALAQPPPGARAAVRLFQFQPGALEVRAGAGVSWTNEDDILHTVTSGVPGTPDGRFEVALAGRGATGTVAFPAPGVYPYFCARHPSMRGRIAVSR